jgi:hypothetical protein
MACVSAALNVRTPPPPPSQSFRVSDVIRVGPVPPPGRSWRAASEFCVALTVQWAAGAGGMGGGGGGPVQNKRIAAAWTKPEMRKRFLLDE